MRIGIFGGTFDPPHLGHLILAAEALEQLKLRRLLWVLTPDPPHKQDQLITSMDTRLALVRAAVDGNPHFELSRVDVNRPGPHYAVDTVRILRREYPLAELVYLIGGDSLRDLPTWHTPQKLVAETDVFGVMRRPDDGVDLQALENILPGIGAKTEWINAPLLEISSSELRERVAAGRTYRYYLSPEVYQVILSHKLYRK